MNNEYLQKIKSMYSWFFDENLKEKVTMVMTMDLDAILSCLLLKQYKGLDVSYLYDFNKGIYIKKGTDITKEKFGVDLSFPNSKMKCISNHFTRINKQDEHNENDINLNIVDEVYLNDYFSKYNLSTFLLIASLVGHKFKDVSSCRYALLADSSFKAYYQPKSFKDHFIQKKLLCDVLGYPDVWQSQTTIPITDFYKAQDILNTKATLFVDSDGSLKFDGGIKLKLICDRLGIEYDMSILDGIFYLIQEHRSHTTNNIKCYDKSDMFSFVVTRKKEIKYSKPVNTY